MDDCEVAGMISDEDIDSLPDDTDAAFVQYEAILRGAVRSANSDSGYRGWESEREYVAHILAFVDLKAIPLDLPKNPPQGDDGFYDWYQNFLRAVDYYKALARLQVSDRKKQNVAVLTLSLDFKTQIGGHLTAIRKIVAEADVSENKRDAIIKRINNLQMEIDRDRTRPEAAMALLLELTSAISKGAKNLDPAIERIERIVKVFAKAKDENEINALAAPHERKRIAPPTTAPETPQSEGSTDNDIPF
jgi:hypothetical protein